MPNSLCNKFPVQTTVRRNSVFPQLNSMCNKSSLQMSYSLHGKA